MHKSRQNAYNIQDIGLCCGKIHPATILASEICLTSLVSSIIFTELLILIHKSFYHFAFIQFELLEYLFGIFLLIDKNVILHLYLISFPRKKVIKSRSVISRSFIISNLNFSSRLVLLPKRISTPLLLTYNVDSYKLLANPKFNKCSLILL